MYSKKITILMIILSLIGILMIYSSSSIWAEYKYGSPFYYCIRQALFFVVGLFLWYIFSKLDYHFLQKKAFIILIICIILLILVLIPGIGIIRGGARSWIGISNFSIQPAEFMKLGYMIFVCKVLSANSENIDKKRVLFFLLILLLGIFGLIMLEPDLGTGFILIASFLIFLYARGLKLKYILSLFILGIIGFLILIVIEPYRIHRIFAFINPWKDPLGSGFQTIQSLYAISPGGLFGVGLFHSRQKYYYLPEPQTDFIFAIITEELGMIGAILILVLFFLLYYYGSKVSSLCKDPFGSLLSQAISILFIFQVLLNICVVIGLVPITGVTLPFLSYGGSSLLLNLSMMGILTNIAKEVEKNNL